MNRLRAFNLAEQMFAYVDRLGPIERLPIPVLLTAARNVSALGDQARALKYLDEAKRADPDFPPTLLSRGQVLMFLGRFEECTREIRLCMRRAPELGQGWWLLSKNLQVADAGEVVRGVRRQLQTRSHGPVDQAMLGFALHLALDHLGQFGDSWEALARACVAKRNTLNYVAEQSRRLVNRLIQSCSRPAEAVEVHAGAVPIFIVGMHRSGTSLLESLLSAHPQVKALGELYDFSHALCFAADHRCQGVVDETIVDCAQTIDLGVVGRRYLESGAWRRGAARHFTDKLPSNFLHIGFICQALPDAKILHLVRDPMETCFSNLRELFSDACAYSYDQIELADYYADYHRLMVHWRQRYPGRIHDVSYAELTQDPERSLREAMAYLGIAFEAGMPRSLGQSAVATASAVQVRKQVSRPSIAKWRAYEAEIQPLAQRLRALGMLR